MLFATRVMEPIGLRVQKPITNTIDEKDAVDYANNWSTMEEYVIHTSSLIFFREFKEEELISVNWCQSEDTPADLFTKNLGGLLSQKHTTIFCGNDDYG
jgi:hypothetical protein